MSSDTQPMWYTIEQAAEKLQVSARTVRRLIAAGQLDQAKVGYRTVRVTQRALDAYVESLDGD